MSDEDRTFYQRTEILEIGAILRKAREDRGLTLADVEQATKIRKRYLQGLENDDYSVLPDAVYTQGFLKTYANYLRLDGEELADRLRSRRRPRRERHVNNGNFRKTGFDEPLISPGGLAGAERRGITVATVLTLLVSVIVIVGIIVALYYVGSESQSTQKDQNQAPPSKKIDSNSNSSNKSSGTSDKSAAGSVEGSSKSAKKPEANPNNQASSKSGDNGTKNVAPPDSLKVSVDVEGSESWISIQSDGALVYEQIAQPGYSQTFEAKKELTITTGNAGAVNVAVNGQDLGSLGGPGEVVYNRSFTLKSAS